MYFSSVNLKKGTARNFVLGEDFVRRISILKLVHILARGLIDMNVSETKSFHIRKYMYNILKNATLWKFIFELEIPLNI